MKKIGLFMAIMIPPGAFIVWGMTEYPVESVLILVALAVGFLIGWTVSERIGQNKILQGISISEKAHHSVASSNVRAATEFRKSAQEAVKQAPPTVIQQQQPTSFRTPPIIMEGFDNE